MVHRGQRSPEARQRRFVSRQKELEAKQLVLALAFRDLIRAETVSRIDMPDADTCPGDVVLDSRGTGSYQPVFLSKGR